MKTIRVVPFALSRNYGYSAEQYQHIAAAIFKYLLEETTFFETDFRYVAAKDIARMLNRYKANPFVTEDTDEIQVKHVEELDNSTFAQCMNEYSLLLYSSSERPRAGLISCSKDNKQLLLVSAPQKFNQHFFIDLNKSKMYGTDNLLYGFEQVFKKYYTANGPNVVQFHTLKKKRKKKKLKMI